MTGVDLTDLTSNEKQLILVMKEYGDGESSEYYANIMDKSKESVIQYAKSLEEKGLIKYKEIVTTTIKLTDEGKEVFKNGFPERILYDSFENSISIKELSKHHMAKIGIGWMKRLGWVKIENGMVIKTGDAPETELEKTMKILSGVSCE